MGKQVGFFATRIDMEAILEHAQRLGLGVLPQFSDDFSVEPVPPRSVTPPTSGSFVYLFPFEVERRAIRWLKLDSTPMSYRLDHDDSPVIQLASCHEREGALQHGRIWTGYDPLVLGKKEADRAYSALSKLIRRWPVTAPHRFHVAPAALADFRAGKVRLATGTIPLTVPEA